MNERSGNFFSFSALKKQCTRLHFKTYYRKRSKILTLGGSVVHVDVLTSCDCHCQKTTGN